MCYHKEIATSGGVRGVDPHYLRPRWIKRTPKNGLRDVPSYLQHVCNWAMPGKFKTLITKS